MSEERAATSAKMRLPASVRHYSETTAAAVIFVLLAVLPILVSGYSIYILPQYLLYGMLAMSLGILWGFTGILSFGQAAFFALGAYAMGLAAKWGFGGNLAYTALVASLVIGAGLAAAVGYFLFSVGVRDVYFVLVTLALSIMVEQITVSQSQITGGYNGMFVPRLSLSLGAGHDIDLSSDAAIYYLVLPVVAAVYFLLRWLLDRPLGKVLVGIRENEDRVISLGFNTSLYKTVAFALSGAIGCLAGALYGAHANFVSPSLAGVLFSTQVVVWVAIGGREFLARCAARRGRGVRPLKLPHRHHSRILAARAWYHLCRGDRQLQGWASGRDRTRVRRRGEGGRP